MILGVSYWPDTPSAIREQCSGKHGMNNMNNARMPMPAMTALPIKKKKKVLSQDRRNDYDVTNAVQVSSPAAVRDAVHELFLETFPGAPFDKLWLAFYDFERLFTGKFPGYKGCDTTYHDMQHTLDMTLALTRLVAGRERPSEFERLTIVIGKRPDGEVNVASRPIAKRNLFVPVVRAGGVRREGNDSQAGSRRRRGRVFEHQVDEYRHVVRRSVAVVAADRIDAVEHSR